MVFEMVVFSTGLCGGGNKYWLGEVVAYNIGE